MIEEKKEKRKGGTERETDSTAKSSETGQCWLEEEAYAIPVESVAKFFFRYG